MGDGSRGLQLAFINFFTMKPVFPPAPHFDYSNEGISKNKTTSWAVIISFTAAYLIVTFVGIVAIMIILLIAGAGEGVSFSISSIIIELFLIPLILLFIYVDGSLTRTRELLRFGSPKRAVLLVLGIPLIAMVVDNIAVLIYAIIFIGIFGEPMTNTDIGTTWDSSSLEIFLAFVGICILTPIGEELMFRGYVLDSINRVHGKWPAILISAVIFGLVHIDPYTIGMATIGGVLYGWIRIRTGSLIPGIVAHSMWNTMALVVTYL